MTGLRTAASFLTVVPAGPAEWQPARAVRWFVLVGAALAALLGLAAVAAFTAFPPPLAAALVVTAWVAVTGALHLDGLADSADAAFAPVPRERRLAILADVHHGTFAVVAVALLLVLKVSALASLDRAGAAAAVALAVLAARALLPLVIRAFPAARPGGLGAAIREGATPAVASAGLLVAMVSGFVMLGGAGVAVVVGLAAVALGAGWWLASRFGGLTGDSYGAVVELVEAVALTAAAGLLSNGHATAFPFGGRL